MAELLPLFRHAAGTASAVGDGELLDRFTTGRDEAAFAELVRRHGPVVFRVCRRLVGPDAAEDAFQAAFLVLATRLDAARAAGSVGGWLVGVAGRVARQMRRAASRRAHHETASAVSRPVVDGDAPDLTDQFLVLDEEIARLPPRLRDPIVLCLLQGRTQEQAATELGRDARTLRRRLGRAKQVLKARLERRGVVPVVAASLVSGAGAVAAVVPSSLGKKTVAVVFDFLTGGTGAARSVPVVVAKGVAMTLFTRKLSHLVAVAVCGLLGVGVVLGGDEKPKPKPRVTAVKTVEVAKPASEPPQQILIHALCVEVPAGFCERCGLDDGPPATSWGLTRREAKMVAELIRTAKGLEVLSRPQLMLVDNQTGFVQVGQQVPVVVATDEKVGNDGVAVAETKVEYRPVGVSLRVTAVVTGEGAGIALQTESQLTQVTPTPVNLGNGVLSPAFNVQTYQSGAALQDGGTVVIRTATTKGNDGKTATEHLWVMTAHFVRTEMDAAEKLRQAASGAATLPAPVLPVPPRVDPRVVPPSGVETTVVIPSTPALGLPQPLPAAKPVPATGKFPPAKP